MDDPKDDEGRTMSLLKFLGLGGDTAGRDAEPESLRAMTSRLEAMPEEEARLAAAYAYLLARVAGADLRTDARERSSIVERLAGFAGHDPERAELLANLAIEAIDEHGGSDNHLVARTFRDITDESERIRLVRCLYAVAAADETITTDEDNEIFEIATAIGVRRNDVIAVRSAWTAHLGTMKALPRER